MLKYVLFKVKGEPVRVEAVEEFDSVVYSVWSKDGSIFPVLAQNGKIYEVGYNSQSSSIIAFSVVPVAEFRRRLTSAAERLYTQKMQEAALKAAEEVAALYSIALRIKENGEG